MVLASGRVALLQWISGIPTKWEIAELDMRDAASSPGALLPDDKDPARGWKAETLEVASYLLDQTVNYPLWQLQPDLAPDHLLQWLHGRVALGLPVFLRKMV